MIRLDDRFRLGAGVTDAGTDEVLANVALNPSNRYLLATRDAAGMREYMLAHTIIVDGFTRKFGTIRIVKSPCDAVYAIARKDPSCRTELLWPLPNLAIACIVNSQESLDSSWPIIAATPAARRGIVVQVMGAVDLVPYVGMYTHKCKCGWHRDEMQLHSQGRRFWCTECKTITQDGDAGRFVHVEPPPPERYDPVDPTGGEPMAAFISIPVNVAWIRSIVDQCAAAGVPVSVAETWPNLIAFDPTNSPTSKWSPDSLSDDLRITDELWGDEC